jgi:hypothetical protein
MRTAALVLILGLTGVALAAEVESRQLTHYVPQDFLEAAIRKEGWTEVPLNVKGGVRRMTSSASGREAASTAAMATIPAFTSTVRGPSRRARRHLQPVRATGGRLRCCSRPMGPTRCLPPGKPLELKLSKDGEKLSIGFNDEKGRYQDNHLGKGKRHELDPLWVRIEVVRIIVD